MNVNMHKTRAAELSGIFYDLQINNDMNSYAAYDTL